MNNRWLVISDCATISQSLLVLHERGFSNCLVSLFIMSILISSNTQHAVDDLNRWWHLLHHLTPSPTRPWLVILTTICNQSYYHLQIFSTVFTFQKRYVFLLITSRSVRVMYTFLKCASKNVTFWNVNIVKLIANGSNAFPTLSCILFKFMHPTLLFYSV
jgi:hypothetical protein